MHLNDNVLVNTTPNHEAFDTPEPCYNLMGERYIDGMMDVKAVTLGKQEETFKLVYEE